ncbi:MAG: sulfotransferase [Bdellovibrionales bacterium]|nr:sulfotransferase [Bdellovibrionales bacterium]
MLDEHIQEWQSFVQRVNLIGLFDHSGRAGNGFFFTVFDLHPEIICCPWMHYTYSYLVRRFGLEQILPCESVHSYWVHEYYFRLLYQDRSTESDAQIIKFGGDPSAVVARDRIRAIFDSVVRGQSTILRRELVLLTYFAYAKGTDRDLSRIRYILTSDVISNYETVLREFRGDAVVATLEDFPKAKLLSLVRDPRAVFASNRHQFVNANGNMYGVRFGTYACRLKELMQLSLGFESCAYLFWILYATTAARSMYRIKKMLPGRFLTIRNEDLNLRFAETLKDICAQLEVSFDARWAEREFMPTSVGCPWRGTGAYNNRYQTNLTGPLQNDSQLVADRTSGPNAYVTRRWRSKLSRSEIALTEHLFREELIDLGYDFLETERGSISRVRLLAAVVVPFRGEIPGLRWLLEGFRQGPRELTERVLYYLSLPLFYVGARAQLWRLITKRRFFEGVVGNTVNPAPMP